MAWWIELQPDWRVKDDGSFNYDMPEDEEWTVLRKTGKAGLVTVIAALSWWVTALTPETPSFRAWNAVRDVKWVINQINVKFEKQPKKRQSGKKRQVEEAAPSGRLKRYDRILYINARTHD